MTFRWYGENNDAVSLQKIQQIPGMAGVVWALHDIPAGEVWPLERIMQVKQYVASYRLHIDVVESVNVHEDIKLGLPSRDIYIARYQETIRNLSRAGVQVICYNFMPIFDWTRTDLFKPMDDGSTALFFEKAKVTHIDPKDLIQKIVQDSGKYTMPGWEPERLSHIQRLLLSYEDITIEQYWDNVHYFLEHIIPVAESCNIKMAIHPDDPPWSIFGLPRIITSAENIARFLQLVESPYNGLTFCTGSLGVNPDNDLPAMIRTFGDTIHFAHIRNVQVYDNGDFIETAHRSSDGTVDIVAIVKAYHDIEFTGYARPDHGRHIWGEEANCRPGYGLYDRAFGAMYILGLWDAFASRNGPLSHCGSIGS